MLEHTHIRCSSWLQTKNATCSSAFDKRYQMTILLPPPPAAKLKSVIPLESGHLGPTTLGNNI